MRYFILAVLCACGVAGADEGASWAAIAGQSALILLQIAGPVLATLIGLGAIWCLRKLAEKLHIDASFIQDAQVSAAVAKGVVAAEEWARKQAVRPTGSAKADIALGAVRELLESKTYHEYGEPALRALIDGAVAKLRASQPPASATVGAMTVTGPAEQILSDR